MYDQIVYTSYIHLQLDLMVLKSVSKWTLTMCYAVVDYNRYFGMTMQN